VLRDFCGALRAAAAAALAGENLIDCNQTTAPNALSIAVTTPSKL
jgi:hypothetical protein